MLLPVSIIIPVLNEGERLESFLQSLQGFRKRGHQVIVADGGSRDNSLSIARRLADRVVMSGAGRALQMNSGADYARHEVLLFLHADTRLPENADQLITSALEEKAARWGRFDIRLSGRHPLFRIIEHTINLRSGISGIATGDQAIFVEREYFERVGGFDSIPLMEDVAISKKLLYFARPRCISQPVFCSSRKWEKHGILRTTLLMWSLRTAYFFGASPGDLHRLYYPELYAQDQK